MKESSKINVLDFLLILFILITVVFGFLMLNKDNFKRIYTKNDASVAENIDLDELILEYKKNYNIIGINYINDKLTCLLSADDNGRAFNSFIIDNKSGNVIIPESLFNIKYKKELEKKIFDLVDKKYAKFIVDKIKSGSGNTIYEFKSNELVLYFKDFVNEEDYNKEIFLHVNYNEIDEYLNFEHKLDTVYKNEDGYEYSKDKVTVAFSFDDGPNSTNTYNLLELLDNYKMTATFFMVGNKMYNQSDVVRAVDNSLNEVGSHSYSHINMKKTDRNAITNELETTNNIFKDITGHEIKLMRPPYGAYTNDIIKDYPYSFILWNVDTNDWRYKDVDYIVNHILTHIEDGNIILMHDSYETTVEAVRRVLPKLYKDDIQVVSVSTLAELKGITLENGKPYLYLK